MDPHAWQHGAGRKTVHAGGRLALGGGKLSQGERDHRRGQGRQHRGQRERRGGGAEQLPPWPPPAGHAIAGRLGMAAVHGSQGRGGRPDQRAVCACRSGCRPAARKWASAVSAVRGHAPSTAATVTGARRPGARRVPGRAPRAAAPRRAGSSGARNAPARCAGPKHGHAYGVRRYLLSRIEQPYGAAAADSFFRFPWPGIRAWPAARGLRRAKAADR